MKTVVLHHDLAAHFAVTTVRRVGTKLFVNYRRGVCRPGAVGMCTSATEPASY